MRVWLDDERLMPSGYDIHCKNSTEIKTFIRSGLVTYISFDHDLGFACETGYDVACLIEELAFYGKIPKIEWTVHSANPTGAQNIKMAMQRADEYWNNYN